MGQNLEIPPLAAEIVLQALRPIVHEHDEIEDSGALLDATDVSDHDVTDDI
jgi:hypothetical protein